MLERDDLAETFHRFATSSGLALDHPERRVRARIAGVYLDRGAQLLLTLSDLAVLGEQQAQVHERLGIFRIAFDGLLVQRCGLLILAFPAVQDAEIVLRLR